MCVSITARTGPHHHTTCLCFFLFLRLYPGQERFHKITRAYYKNAHGIVLVYDVSDRRSFEQLRTWLAGIGQYAAESVRGCILCNKVDLKKDLHRVLRKEGEDAARECNFKFYETSAKTGLNVKVALESLARSIVSEKLVRDLSSSSTTPAPEDRPRRKRRGSSDKKCCVQ